MAIRQWNGQTGMFASAANWSPAGVPGPDDTADLSGSLAYVVTQAGTVALGVLQLDDPLATLIVGGTVQAAGGWVVNAGTLLDGGMLDMLAISLGTPDSSTPAVLQGAFLSNLSYYPYGYVSEPGFGAGVSIVTNGTAQIGFSTNAGSILAQSGTLTLSGDPADGTHAANPVGRNSGTITTAGALLMISAYSDYLGSDVLPYGVIRIAAGGTLEVTDAFARIGTTAISHANVSFADASGTIAVATNPTPAFLDPATLAVANFQSGDVLTSVYGGVSSFDAASNTLTFADPTSGAVHATLTFGSAHGFSAAELQGLGSATVTTSYVIPNATGNGIPGARPATAQWLGQSGQFGDANQWTPAGVPGSGETASLAGTAAYAVRQSGSVTVAALILDDALGTLGLGGWLRADGGFSLQAGNVYLTGTLASTTVTQTGGTLLAASTGTLSGDRWIGGLRVAGSLTVSNGLTLLGADGSSAGTMDLSGGALVLADTETLDHAGITLGGATATLQAAADLTLGPQATLTVSAATATLAVAGLLDDAGQIAVAAGGRLRLSAGSLSSSGRITVAAAGELDLTMARIGLAQVAAAISLDAAGTLGLSGTFDLAGTTVATGVGSVLNRTVFTGAVLSSGTVVAGGGSFSGTGLGLVAVDWHGALTLGAGVTLTADASDRFDSADGTAPGTIDLTAGAVLQDGGTLDAVEIDLAGGGALRGQGATDPLGHYIVTNPVLGSGAAVIASGDATVAMALNRGAISSLAGTLSLSGGNLGTVAAVGGVLIAHAYTDYVGGGAIPTGQSVIANGGTFELAGTSAVAANLRFADNSGSLLIATDAGLAATRAAVAGFQAGDTLAASLATGSSFDAASNTLSFLYADGGRAMVTLSGDHAFTAADLLGLGSATITTDFVAQPIVNHIPTGSASVPQWLGQSGAFGDAANWSPAGVPGSGATASLAGTVAYAASQSGTTTLSGLILNAPLGTLGLGGTLMAGGFALQSGSLYLSGTLRNTQVTQTGGTLLASSTGTLDGDGWTGALTVAGSLTVRNGLNLSASDGSQPGSLRVTGALTFADATLLDHAAIDLNGQLLGANGLTLGAQATLTAASGAVLSGDIHNAGVLRIGSGQSLAVAGAFANTGSVAVDGGTLALAGVVRNSGVISAAHGAEIDLGDTSLAAILAAGISLDASSSLVVTGTLDLGGGTLTLGPGGTLPGLVLRNAVLADGVVDSSGGDVAGSLAGLANVVWRGPLNITSSDSVRVDAASQFTDATGTQPGSIAIAAGGTLTDTTTLDNVQIALGDWSSGASAVLDGQSTAYAPVLVLGPNAGVVANGIATLTIAANQGAIAALSGAVTLIDPGAAGNILVDGGLLIAESFTVGPADGMVTIANGGTFAVVNGVADPSGHSATVDSTHANVTFADGTGTLEIAALAFRPLYDALNVPAMVEVSGFQAGDTITADLGYGSFDAVSNTLSFFDPTSNVTTAIVHFDPAHPFDPTEIYGLGGNSIGTLYTESAAITACFATGTRIATTRGDIPVEALAVGDLALTADGGTAPVIWIGQRTVECTLHPRPHDVMPIRVAAGAFGDLPVRDLLLSPDHAVWIDGALIPVRYLQNGASIHQHPVLRVTYWHVELPRHAVILAERLPAESYLDTGNRHAFSNGGPVVQMQPEFARAVWAREGCAPLLTAGPALRAIRERLDAQARTDGFCLTAAAELYLLVEGVRIDPVQIDGAWYFNSATPGRVHLMSPAASPAETDPASADWRRLGVAVRAMRWNGKPLDLDGPAFGTGWRPAEPGWRWSDGAGALRLDGGVGELVVELAMVARRWLPPMAGRRNAGVPRRSRLA